MTALLGVAVICATVLIATKAMPAAEFFTVLGLVLAALSPSPLTRKGPSNE